MGLRDIGIFSEAEDYRLSVKAENERLKRARGERAEDLQRGFGDFQGEIRDGKASSGDPVQDWFIVHYLSSPVIGSFVGEDGDKIEDVDELIGRWKAVRERAKDFVGKPVASLEQTVREERVLNVGVPGFGRENASFPILDERLRMGVLTGDVEFDMVNGRIVVPTERHAVLNSNGGREGRVEMVEGGIVYEGVRTESILGGFADYSALGVQFECGQEVGQRIGAQGLGIYFGEETDSALRRFSLPDAFRMIDNLGIGENYRSEFRDGYREAMVKYVSGKLRDIEKLMSNVEGRGARAVIIRTLDEIKGADALRVDLPSQSMDGLMREMDMRERFGHYCKMHGVEADSTS